MERPYHIGEALICFRNAISPHGDLSIRLAVDELHNIFQENLSFGHFVAKPLGARFRGKNDQHKCLDVLNLEG